MRHLPGGFTERSRHRSLALSLRLPQKVQQRTQHLNFRCHVWRNRRVAVVVVSHFFRLPFLVASTSGSKSIDRVRNIHQIEETPRHPVQANEDSMQISHQLISQIT